MWGGAKIISFGTRPSRVQRSRLLPSFPTGAEMQVCKELVLNKGWLPSVKCRQHLDIELETTFHMSYSPCSQRSSLLETSSSRQPLKEGGAALPVPGTQLSKWKSPPRLQTSCSSSRKEPHTFTFRAAPATGKHCLHTVCVVTFTI